MGEGRGEKYIVDKSASLGVRLPGTLHLFPFRFIFDSFNFLCCVVQGTRERWFRERDPTVSLNMKCKKKKNYIIRMNLVEAVIILTFYNNFEKWCSLKIESNEIIHMKHTYHIAQKMESINIIIIYICNSDASGCPWGLDWYQPTLKFLSPEQSKALLQFPEPPADNLLMYHPVCSPSGGVAPGPPCAARPPTPCTVASFHPHCPHSQQINQTQARPASKPRLLIDSHRKPSYLKHFCCSLTF